MSERTRAWHRLSPRLVTRLESGPISATKIIEITADWVEDQARVAMDETERRVLNDLARKMSHEKYLTSRP